MESFSSRTRAGSSACTGLVFSAPVFSEDDSSFSPCSERTTMNVCPSNPRPPADMSANVALKSSQYLHAFRVKRFTSESGVVVVVESCVMSILPLMLIFSMLASLMPRLFWTCFFISPSYVKHSEHMRPMRNFSGETSLLRPECCSFLMA